MVVMEIEMVTGKPILNDKGTQFCELKSFYETSISLTSKTSGWEAVEPSSLVEKSTLVQKVERYLENTLMSGKYLKMDRMKPSVLDV